MAPDISYDGGPDGRRDRGRLCQETGKQPWRRFLLGGGERRGSLLAGLEGKLEGMLIVWVGETAEENFKKIAKSFEEATGMTVELVTYTGLSASDKLALDGPAGNGGDVYVQGGGGTMAKSVDQGLFMELPEAAFDIGAFTESAVDDYRYGGKLYGLPMGSETPALIYNKALIQTIPDTWEALMEECGKFADIPNDKYGLLMDPTNPYFTNALFVANGGYVFGEKDGGLRSRRYRPEQPGGQGHLPDVQELL